MRVGFYISPGYILHITQFQEREVKKMYLHSSDMLVKLTQP